MTSLLSEFYILTNWSLADKNFYKYFFAEYSFPWFNIKFPIAANALSIDFIVYVS